MEIRISDELNDIIRYARDEAMRTGSYGIGPDHLFLGVLRHGDNAAFRTVTGLGIDADNFKRFIDSHIFTNEPIPYAESDKISFTRYAQNVLSITVLEASKQGVTEANSLHLLLALCRTTENYGQAYLRQHGVDYGRLLSYMRDEGMLGKDPEQEDDKSEDDQQETNQESKPEKSVIEDFGFDLTKAAAEGKLDPVVGRETEIARVIEILGRRKKNNPMLIGEPGVGKSAIVEGIALRIAGGSISPALAKKRLISLDIALVVAGTKYRGDFEKRLKSIIKEASSNPDIILFIDEFHTIVGAGGAQGSLDAANILKPTDIQQSITILENLKPNYEDFHKVAYSDEAIEACVRLTDRYITDKSLPDKAIDALDEAGSMVRLNLAKNKRNGNRVDAEDIATVVSKMTGIPVNKVAESEGNRIMKMKARLQSRIIGQDDAIEKVVRAIQRNRAGLKDPNRPEVIMTMVFRKLTTSGRDLSVM